jgi:predicted nucleic acid-binding protein
MYSPKLYLETTMFNFFFYGKDKEKQVYTKRLFEDIAAGKYEPYTSDYVITEIRRASKEKFDNMIALIDKYKITVLPLSKEIELLGAIYVSKGIIPEKYKDDATHIAAATVNGLDFVVSYNYNHIVKLKTIIGTGLINRMEGYQQVGLSTPKEILDYGN